ncbi:hypothetical protein [Nostoc sp. MS1]|nr:hypothetical protein [Nostoc sp. MS1]
MRTNFRRSLILGKLLFHRLFCTDVVIGTLTDTTTASAPTHK